MPLTLLPSRICTVACGPVVGVPLLHADSAKSRTRIDASFIRSPPWVGAEAPSLRHVEFFMSADAERFETPIERAAAEAKRARGLRLVASRLLQCVLHGLAREL